MSLFSGMSAHTPPADTPHCAPADTFYGAPAGRRVTMRALAEAGVTAVIIDPLNSNTAAQRFYQRLGFVEVGRRMFDQDDCLVMRLEKTDWQSRQALQA